MSPTNPLAKLIAAEIETYGPMSLSSFMRLALTHPEYGYYKNRDPLGTRGDFVTAPEISQMFGEMIGVWMTITWTVLGRPDRFVLGELGPGRGTLMADALRVIEKQPDMRAAMKLVLLETNQTLRDQQSELLGNYSPSFAHEISELATYGAPLILVANEFFDALPIRQYQWQSGNWHERLIGHSDGQFKWGLSSTPIDTNLMPASLNPQQDGEVFEDAPLALATMSEIAKTLNKVGGGFLAIDYGYTSTQTGETLQALANHKMVNPLENPGQADLTSHVNFEALVNAATKEGAQAHIVGTQAQLLEELGIKERAKTLKSKNPDRATQIDQDLDRLIGQDQMGDLFKTMVVFGQSPAAPPYLKSKNLSHERQIQHGFFGRQGGVSPAPFNSLNISYSNHDPREHVDQNRARIAAAFDVPPARLATVQQVHSADVITIDENTDLLARPPADGLVTKVPGILLGILTADCTPVLFADVESGIVGACHAGWQGARDGVVANTIQAMLNIGAVRKNIVAAIGPNISYANYEVGPDFAQNIIGQYPDAAQHLRVPEKGSREHFDLTGFVRDRLAESGVANIEIIGACTYAEPEVYFSHRYATHKGIVMGRQMSVIGLT